jgi:CRP/FNR family cyclic AMP-dependent transcriptional regulator
MEIEEIQHALENCELFKGLERSDVEQISTLCTMREYRAGEYVFRQGESGEIIYIIASGQVFLERSVDLGSRKGKAVIGMLGKGRAFGCWATILNEPHNLMSSAFCNRDAKVVVMNGFSLRSVMLGNTEMGFKMLERICLLLRDRLQGALGAMEKI